jgi:lipopolysaccharide export system permease protein
MRLLQRYILVELIRVFLFILSVLTPLLVFFGVFREATERGLGPDQTLQILPFIVPSLLPFTIPATLLLTVCIVYGRMSGDHEITAAKAAGINLMSLMWPAMFLGAILSVCSLLLTDQVIPWSEAKMKSIVIGAMEEIVLDVLRSEHYLARNGNMISVLGVDQKTLTEPHVRFTPPGKKPIQFQAQSATMEFDLDAQLINFHLYNGKIDRPGQVSVWFKECEQPIPLSTFFAASRTKPRHISMRQIKRNLTDISNEKQSQQDQHDAEVALSLVTGNFDRLEESSLTQHSRQVKRIASGAAKLKTELHSRFAFACSCFFFALMGSPFSILMAKRQFLTVFFLSFLPILIVYYPVVLFMMQLSKAQSINPAWSMWVGNGLLLIAGGFILRRVLRH